MTATPAELTVKARLRNFGNGILVITGDNAKFYVETGRFRKQRKVAREIPIADVESVERQGNDLSITWKGVTETFAVEKASQVEPIYERITIALKERKKDAENKVVPVQEKIELGQMTIKAVETADSLFGILEDLHGRIDWNLVETSFKKVEENAKNLANQPNSLCLDVRPLFAAVQDRRPKEIAEKTLSVLRVLSEHFDGLSSSVENTEQFHPNGRIARMAIQANYILDDMLFGTVVGDDDVEKESAELLSVLDDLSKLPGSKVEVSKVKAALDRLCVEKKNQASILAEVHSTLGQQLKELLVPEQATSG